MSTEVSKQASGLKFSSKGVKDIEMTQSNDNHVFLRIVGNDGSEYVIWLSSVTPITGRFEAL